VELRNPVVMAGNLDQSSEERHGMLKKGSVQDDVPCE
jgi:hypothetical protein